MGQRSDGDYVSNATLSATRRDFPKGGISSFWWESRLSTGYFPDFGFYPIVDPMADVSQTPMVADAIGDLRDIRRDLLEVLWRWENIGQADATDAFCESCEIHWGRFHLPGLRHYVSARLLNN